MQLPDDVLYLIKEYSRPCKNWRKGSYIYQLYKSKRRSFLNDLKIHIVENFWDIDFLERLQMQYYLLTHSSVYKKKESRWSSLYFRKLTFKRLIKRAIDRKKKMYELDRTFHYTF